MVYLAVNPKRRCGTVISWKLPNDRLNHRLGKPRTAVQLPLRSAGVLVNGNWFPFLHAKASWTRMIGRHRSVAIPSAGGIRARRTHGMPGHCAARDSCRGWQHHVMRLQKKHAADEQEEGLTGRNWLEGEKCELSGGKLADDESEKASWGLLGGLGGARRSSWRRLPPPIPPVSRRLNRAA